MKILSSFQRRQGTSNSKNYGLKSREIRNENKNKKLVICFFQSLNLVDYDYKNVPFETTNVQD